MHYSTYLCNGSVTPNDFYISLYYALSNPVSSSLLISITGFNYSSVYCDRRFSARNPLLCARLLTTQCCVLTNLKYILQSNIYVSFFSAVHQIDFTFSKDINIISTEKASSKISVAKLNSSWIAIDKRMVVKRKRDRYFRSRETRVWSFITATLIKKRDPLRCTTADDLLRVLLARREINWNTPTARRPLGTSNSHYC